MHPVRLRGETRAGRGLCLWIWALLVVPTAIGAAVPLMDRQIFDMTLDQAIERALEHNRALLNLQLDRKAQRFSLDVAKDRWRPRFTIRPSVSDDRSGRKAQAGVETGLRVPTGGEFTFRLEETLSGVDNTGTQSIRFSQPLLKGAGSKIETGTVRQARIEEKHSILTLQQTVVDLVVSVTRAYRALIGAVRQVEISEASLKRAREQLKATRTLIRSGRVAQREAVRSEAAVANRELALAQAQNLLDAANFSLIGILELDSAVRIHPLDVLKVYRGDDALEPTFEQVLQNRADFQQARLRIESARINLEQAIDNLRPDLSLELELRRDDSGQTDTLAQLNATIPLNDRSPALHRLRAQNELQKAERNLIELRESISIEARQAANDVEVGLRLIELARGARELAQENLEIEQKKFAQGLSSSFEVSASEEELVRAEQAEADTIITWLNALARLDKTLGRTLARWGIRLEAAPE